MLPKINLFRFFQRKHLNIHFDQNSKGSYLPGQVFRSDSRNFEVIRAAGGFKTLGSDLSYHAHLFNKPSDYVSTSMSKYVPLRFSKVTFKTNGENKKVIDLTNTLYQLNFPKIHVDATISALNADDKLGPNFILSEVERTSVGSIPLSDIYKSRPYLTIPTIGFPFVFIDEVNYNADYKHRNYSLGILSGSEIESELFQKIMRDESALSPKLRAMTLTEARTVAAMLDQASTCYQTKPGDPIFIITYVPSACDNIDKLLHYIEDKYHAFAKEKNWLKAEGPGLKAILSTQYSNLANQSIFNLPKIMKPSSVEETKVNTLRK